MTTADTQNLVTPTDSRNGEVERLCVQRFVRALPRRLKTALEAVVNQEGDDIYFVLGYLNPSTARSYMSQLKYRGLAYTHRSGSTTEVWAHNKGRKLVRPNAALCAGEKKGHEHE